MKANYCTVVLIGISVWFAAVWPAFACSPSDVQNAKNLMSAGNYDQAVSWLTDCAGEGAADAEVYFQLGTAYLYQAKIKQAETQFQQAVQRDNNYQTAIGQRYKEIGMGKLGKGRTREAGVFFRKAVAYEKDLSQSIVESCFEKGTKTLKKAYFDLAVDLDADYRIKIFNFLMGRANKASDGDSLGLYQLAAAYCGETCDLIKRGGKRLTGLIEKMEKRNPLDAKIARYKELADHFIDSPPDYKVYEPGIYPFKLAKGAVTKWIRCKGQGDTSYEFRSDNQKYEVYLRNGKTYRAWAGDSFPETVNSDIKIKALEATVIFLTLRR